MDSFQRRLVIVTRVWAFALAYAVTVAAIAALLSVTAGIATGGGFVRGKSLLFVSGWLLVAYATASMWPTSPEDLDDPGPAGEPSVSPDDDLTRVQSLSREVPPVRWIQPPPSDERISRAGKVFVAGLVTLFASFLMETWFGIT